MWEILIDYTLIDPDNKKLNVFNMAEAPGGFVQACIYYNDKINKTPLNSKFFGISLHNEIKFNYELQKQHGSGKDRRFFEFKTDSKMNGDITTISVINSIKKAFTNEKPDLITADGGFDPLNENYQEQESYMLLLGEIFTAISIQKKGGHFVCKFFDMYTNVTIKLVYILSMFYNDVHLDKPYTSRLSNSERYVIAKDFKYSSTDKEYIQYYTKLEEIVILCKKDQLANKNILDIFVNFEIPGIYRSKIANYNKEIGLNQYISIYTRLEYFKLFNLSGEEFQQFSKKQENATQFWVAKYLS
jgi:hypothetical protein